MAMNHKQQQFVERLVACIPRLFEAISAGNVKSEFHVGSRRVGDQQILLKMVAEVLDSGENPLKTHSMPAPVLDSESRTLSEGIQKSGESLPLEEQGPTSS